MQAFGIEIRKKDNVRELYKDVDLILRATEMPPGGVSRMMQIQAVAHALQNMLQVGKHFSICTVTDCAKVVQIHISAERMRIYQTAHCMDWNAMTTEYRQGLIAMVLDDFRSVLMAEQ